MMLKIFICLAIIIVIFIILNYCLSSQENFDEDNENDEKYEVSHNETFDANNFYDYFLRIHDYSTDKQKLKHLLTGGLVDIYFRQLLNINMFYKDQILSGLDETSVPQNSFYLVTNMANFMYYDKMSEIYYNNLDYEGVNGTEPSLYPDFQNYFIIIKNPILKEMNSIRFGNRMEGLLSNIAIIKKYETICAVQGGDLAGTTRPFNIISKGLDFEELAIGLFDNILVKFNSANYFRNNQDNHLGILYHLDSNLNINEIYSYDFNITETPSFLEETPDPNSVNNKFKYNWVLQSDNEVVKNVNYFDENSKSGFTLENFDIYDLFMKKYEMYTTISEDKYLRNENKSINCEPEPCDPTTTNPDCKTRDEVFTDLFSERAKNFPLFYFLSIYTNYITLDNLSIRFFKDQEKKLIPLIINYQENSRFDTGTISENNNFDSQMEEKNIFRVLLFYKIFKYDLYNLDQIAKISYLVIIFLYNKLRETNLKNQRLELFQEYMDRSTAYRQLSFVFQVKTLDDASLRKDKIATIIQNMILRDRDTDIEKILNLFKESEFERNFFECNWFTSIGAEERVEEQQVEEQQVEEDRVVRTDFEGVMKQKNGLSTISTKKKLSVQEQAGAVNNRGTDLVDYSLKLKLFLEDSSLKIFTQLENITNQDLYPEELIYSETDDSEVINYSSIKKLNKMNYDLEDLKIKLDIFIENIENIENNTLV